MHATLIREHPLVEKLYQLTQSYVKLMRERDVEVFDPWIEQCLRSGLLDLESFAQGLQMDHEAVKTSLVLYSTNGAIEEQVNRSMFGRGSFELLRTRFLRAA
jgi:transposase